MAGVGSPLQVVQQGRAMSLWLMLRERVQNTSGSAGRRGSKDEIIGLCRLNVDSTACYDFEGLLEFHSRQV